MKKILSFIALLFCAITTASAEDFVSTGTVATTFSGGTPNTADCTLTLTPNGDNYDIKAEFNVKAYSTYSCTMTATNVPLVDGTLTAESANINVDFSNYSTSNPTLKVTLGEKTSMSATFLLAGITTVTADMTDGTKINLNPEPEPEPTPTEGGTGTEDDPYIIKATRTIELPDVTTEYETVWYKVVAPFDGTAQWSINRRTSVYTWNTRLNGGSLVELEAAFDITKDSETTFFSNLYGGSADNGRIVTVTLTEKEVSSIESAEIEAESGQNGKVIKDNRLVILSNHRQFNAAGQLIK